MKAILVIDKPENCDECGVKCDGYTAKQHAERGITRPYWCPLKPLPQKKVQSFNELHLEEEYLKEGHTRGWKDFVKEKLTEFDMGYNKCIDEILGEEE